MPSWDELLAQMQGQAPQQRQVWLQGSLTAALGQVGHLRNGRNVILYTSAFLRKPDVPSGYTMIAHEDLNGFMSVIYKMDPAKGLTLVLHTPGGVTNAAETLISYIRSKFNDVEVIIPTFAMSAGTMICLSADRLVMGRQSQLGPIDPQMNIGSGRSMSARAITEQFERAKTEIAADSKMAYVWGPILQSLGPALLQEAQNALDYSERMVAEWLAEHMFHDHPKPKYKGKAVARHFNNASKHKSHGRRIDRAEAEKQGVKIEYLENDQQLQDQVLTAYHLMAIIFLQTSAVKLLWSDAGKTWQKAWYGTTSTPQP